MRHPATLGSSEVEAFLSWLANERKVSVSTHRQALAALLFFYGKGAVHGSALASGDRKTSAVAARLPVVLTPDEVVRILGFLEGEHRLFAQLLYGTGMRISEGLQLRVKDLDFDHGSSCRRARAPGSGLDVTRELGTQPARSCRVHGHGG